jgi:hypothetical protein
LNFHFNAVPDPAFHSNADPYPVSPNNADGTEKKIFLVKMPEVSEEGWKLLIEQWNFFRET